MLPMRAVMPAMLAYFPRHYTPHTAHLMRSDDRLYADMTCRHRRARTVLLRHGRLTRKKQARGLGRRSRHARSGAAAQANGVSARPRIDTAFMGLRRHDHRLPGPAMSRRPPARFLFPWRHRGPIGVIRTTRQHAFTVQPHAADILYHDTSAYTMPRGSAPPPTPGRHDFTCQRVRLRLRYSSIDDEERRSAAEIWMPPDFAYFAISLMADCHYCTRTRWRCRFSGMPPKYAR